MTDPVDLDPSDSDRYPVLGERGRQMLEFLREHPHAPIYRNRSGHRLGADDIDALRALHCEALDSTLDWQPNVPPAWVAGFIASAFEKVPAYRAYGAIPRRLADLPTISRADLSRDIAQYVPDDMDVQRLINYRTSGTTGHPLLIASDPLVAGQYLGYHERALRLAGIELRHGAGQVGVVLLGHQRKCFTYVSVTPLREESGLAKINLHPDDWRHQDDRAKYLDALSPEVVAGDPISFAELLQLPVTFRPRALLSTSMALMPALRENLESRFDCPVLDLYSLNEAGPIAVSLGGGPHLLLQHRMYVEIVDERGVPVAPGERGEITLTGGFNFCLPLLRYRTGDFASLQRRGADLLLLGLAGRPVVRFRADSGEWLNNIEITHAMRPFPLVQFWLHQAEDGAIAFEYQGSSVDAAQVESALRRCFGAAQKLTVRGPIDLETKRVQYTSDLL